MCARAIPLRPTDLFTRSVQTSYGAISIQLFPILLRIGFLVRPESRGSGTGEIPDWLPETIIQPRSLSEPPDSAGEFRDLRLRMESSIRPV